MKRCISKILSLTRNRDGNAMLEFALGAGMMVAVFTGTFQFGYTFLQYNNLQNAVARGAHYAALVPYDSATTTPSAAFKTAVQNMVLYGTPTAGTSPVLSGLTASNVNFTVTFTNGVPSAMTVSITGYTINSIFSSSTLTNKPQVTYTYQGVWSPV
jgi:Flp pilus assembly protein TadG